MSDFIGRIRYRIQLRLGSQSAREMAHRVNRNVVESTYELRIAQFDNDPGFYLIHLNESQEEIAGTYHDS